MNEKPGVWGWVRRVEWRTVLLLVVITGIALAFRLYRLKEQSAWIDDAQVLTGMNAPNLSTYAKLVRVHGKDAVPFYFSLLYYWYWISGYSLYALRLPTVLFNVACVPLLYGLTRAVFNKKAGAIAALCLALSPTQIFYAQMIHVYAFLGLLVLASTWALYRAARTRRLRWWLLVSGINLMAVWTHPFAVFFVCTECVYILWQLRARPRHAFGWIAIQGLCCLSILIFMYKTLLDVAKPEEDFTYQVPPLKALLADWVADDAVMTADPFSFQGTTWGFLPEGVQRTLVAAHTWVDWVMIAFLGACVAWCLYAVIRALWSEDFRRTRFRPPDAVHGAALVLTIALVPLLIHLFLSLTWRPILLQRYTSYSALAVYAAIGAGIAFIRSGLVRKGAVAMLLILYGYQLSLALPAATRTDYLSAAHHIAASAQPVDAVLVAGCFLSWDAFRVNAGPTAYPILPAYSLTAVCDKAARLLRNPNGPRRARIVWAVIEPFVFTLPPLEQFEQRLGACELTWTRKDFPGMNKLYVYRIVPLTDPGSRAKPPLPELTAKTDYARILSDLGFDPADRRAYEAARLALREAWDVEFPRTPLYYSTLALQLAAEGYLDLALRAVERAGEIDPGSAYAQFVHAIILGEKGKTQAAKEAFERAVALDLLGYTRLYEPLFKALYLEKDLPTARARLDELDRLHAMLPVVFYIRAGVWPLAAQARLTP